jgi:copper chaperone CopZ
MKPLWATFLLLAAPLSAEVLETEIVFEGTGCLSCAESLEPRLKRVRGVESVELDLDKSRIKLKLEPGNQARLGPLRLRVTQDGTKIVEMTAAVQGVAAEKDGAWTLTVTGPNETLALTSGHGVRFESGRAYRVHGAIREAADGALTLAAESAEPVPSP